MTTQTSNLTENHTKTTRVREKGKTKCDPRPKISEHSLAVIAPGPLYGTGTSEIMLIHQLPRESFRQQESEVHIEGNLTLLIGTKVVLYILVVVNAGKRSRPKLAFREE